jgi:hypothetical protein
VIDAAQEPRAVLGDAVRALEPLLADEPA